MADHSLLTSEGAPVETNPPVETSPAALTQELQALLPPEGQALLERLATSLTQRLHTLEGRQSDLLLKEQNLLSLIDISNRLVRETDLDALLDLILLETTRLMGADRSSLFLVDHEQMEIWSKIAQGTQEIRLPLGKGIAGFVAQTGEVINMSDAYSDNRFDQSTDQRTGYRTRSVLCVPMVNLEGTIIGVVQVLNKREGVFVDADIKLLQALAAQAAVAIENARMHKDLDLLLMSTLKALSKAIDARDHYTQGHSYRVSIYAVAIGQQMGLGKQDLKVLEMAAAMHDVGKIGIRDNVLCKPGLLTPEEYAMIRKHVEFTHDILSEIYFPRHLRHIAEIAASHHEKLDGTGYYRGLKGDEVPLPARILAVADVYDAITSDRPYRSPMPDEEAFMTLRAGIGHHFDGGAVEAFIAWRMAHPDKIEPP